MHEEIKFSKEVTFIGRNDSISINPITSKGDRANCEVTVPTEDIPAVCAKLGLDLTSLVLKNIPPDCLPLLLGLNPQLDVLLGQEMSK